MKSLEERQKEWDEKYEGPNSKEVKSRPARPTKEGDENAKDNFKKVVDELLKKRSVTQEEAFLASRSDRGKLGYILTTLTHQEIDFELRKSIFDRSMRIVSLTKETPYGIAHFDIQISINEIANNNRLARILEQGISDIYRSEKELYNNRREYNIPNSQDFFNRRY